ncbi:MAG: hypothetical protein ACOC9Y_08010, partial [Chloroflexota bacterium]
MRWKREKAISHTRKITKTSGLELDRSDGRPLQIVPTDVAQFIRLDQCDRYLRLRLYHRQQRSATFLGDFGVVPQPLPPLLRHSGLTYEAEVVDQIEKTHSLIRLDTDRGDGEDDNERILEVIDELPPGETIVISQARIHAVITGWEVRGDIDILRLERNSDGNLSLLVADIKSSRTGKLEHRLQVAMYIEMLESILQQVSAGPLSIDLGILYRGASHHDSLLPDDERQRLADQQQSAQEILGVTSGYLEIADDSIVFRDAVADLVTGEDSRAREVASKPFEEVN